MSTATAPVNTKAAYADSAAASHAITAESAPFWTTAVARLADYLELTKPRISVMVLVTVVVGYTLGCRGDWQLAALLPALVGIGLVAFGSSALNQYRERFTDARMTRTQDRPLPSGRLSPREVFTFGVLCGVAGTLWLAMTVNLLTALLTLGTLILYVALYTPLKRHTSVCTAIGAIPGALPPVLGWAAARDSLDAGALSLFVILFLWQFPHFLAIAWMYRDQYSGAGLKMLPGQGASRVASLLAVTYAVVLIPASLLPQTVALAGDWYTVVAILLGLMYLASAIRFAWRETRATARELLLTSLVYLPLLLMALTFDHLRLLM